jgi:hypothetical protein
MCNVLNATLFIHIFSEDEDPYIMQISLWRLSDVYNHYVHKRHRKTRKKENEIILVF